MTTIVNECRVERIDSMGHDLRVVDAARVSFNKQSALIDGAMLSTGDARLIKYLADNQHWTPFAHVMFTLRIACPVFVARQWFRHTIGVVHNEVSRRYVDDNVAYFLPDVIRAKPEGSIKQGSGGAHPNSDLWRQKMKIVYDQADELYESMIKDGVAPEQARIILPLAHMTEFYETASLAFYARAAGLRLDGHAQGEIRDMMQKIADVVAPVAGVSWRANCKT
jgi:thymidylate synthase (FAD)